MKAEPRIEAGFHIPNTVGCIGCEAFVVYTDILIYCAVSISHALYPTSAKSAAGNPFSHAVGASSWAPFAWIIISGRGRGHSHYLVPNMLSAIICNTYIRLPRLLPQWSLISAPNWAKQCKYPFAVLWFRFLGLHSVQLESIVRQLRVCVCVCASDYLLPPQFRLLFCFIVC